MNKNAKSFMSSFGFKIGGHPSLDDCDSQCGDIRFLCDRKETDRTFVFEFVLFQHRIHG